MHVGEVMSVPLAGKSVPFRVVKRRSKGFNSVVFECREEQEEAMGDEADRPRRVVTVKVCVSCMDIFRLGSSVLLIVAFFYTTWSVHARYVR